MSLPTFKVEELRGAALIVAEAAGQVLAVRREPLTPRLEVRTAEATLDFALRDLIAALPRVADYLREEGTRA